MRPLIKLIKKILGVGPSLPANFPLYNFYHRLRGMTAAILSGFPSSKLVVIGITGTNGKTATASMLAHVLEAAGNKVGLLTTVNFWIAGKKWVNETKMTTDSPFTTQRMLRKMVNAGCRYAVMETSSHALAQHRTWGTFYDVAVFTNLTQDHLDYHRTMANYRDAKAKLFRDLYDSWRKPNTPKVMVLNFDDPIHSHFGQYPADAKMLYSMQETDLPDMLRATDIESTSAHSKFTLRAPSGSANITLQIPGRFNIANALAAASTAYALGFSVEQIKIGLEAIAGIAGRMERIDAGQPFNVIVDYAHTPDGYDKALSSIRQFTPNKLIVVFGSAGDRDKTKRPLLGEIAGRYADILVLTEEDPGSEDPAKIIAEVRAGIPTDKFAEDQNLFVIPRREDAVPKALSLASASGDTVAFLALGAQTKMVRRKGLMDYDERKYIRNLLQSTVGH
ncbi:MAG: UDP-N-acetylmuramoyl-L-alanyl-D-glutamate--2,6-diaminopimelate ligase [bacterium]